MVVVLVVMFLVLQSLHSPVVGPGPDSYCYAGWLELNDVLLHLQNAFILFNVCVNLFAMLSEKGCRNRKSQTDAKSDSGKLRGHMKGTCWAPLMNLLDIYIPSDMNLHHYHQHRDHHHHHHQWMLKKTHFSDRAGSSNNWLPLANNYSSSQLTSWRADPVTTKHPVSRSPALKLIVYKNTLMMKQNSDPPRIPWLDMRLIHLKRASVLILEIRDEGEILPLHQSARDLMRHGSGHSPRREYFGT